MAATTKELEEFIGNYVYHHGGLESCILSNLYLFYQIACEVEETLNEYFENVKELHTAINKCDFLECINKMGLNDLGMEDRNLILKSFQNIKEIYFSEKGRSL